MILMRIVIMMMIINKNTNSNGNNVCSFHQEWQLMAYFGHIRVITRKLCSLITQLENR